MGRKQASVSVSFGRRLPVAIGSMGSSPPGVLAECASKIRPVT